MILILGISKALLIQSSVAQLIPKRPFSISLQNSHGEMADSSSSSYWAVSAINALTFLESAFG